MRLAVLADIHGNRPALEAVIADLAARRVDDVVDLGDSVSGPLWPRETLALLRERGWPTLRGNHDRWVGRGDPGTLSRTDRFAAEQLTGDERRWLAELPARRSFGALTAFHARPADDNAYLLEDVVAGRLVRARPEAIAERLAGVAAAVVLTAHSHLAAVMRLPDGRWIVNPGSVGLPAYDDPEPPAHVSESGSPAARYAILAFDEAGLAEGRLTAELLAIPYDHAAASRRAAALGRDDWASALSCGYAGLKRDV